MNVNNLIWQIPAAWSALSVLLLMSVIVYYGIRNYITARRLAPQYNYDMPAARPVVLVRLIAAWLFALACTVFSFWCIFW